MHCVCNIVLYRFFYIRASRGTIDNTSSYREGSGFDRALGCQPRLCVGLSTPASILRWVGNEVHDVVNNIGPFVNAAKHLIRVICELMKDTAACK